MPWLWRSDHVVQDAEREVNPDESNATWDGPGSGALGYLQRPAREEEMIIDDAEDFDDPTPIVVCPECGSDDLEIIDEDNGEYECLDCGERFTDGEEDDA